MLLFVAVLAGLLGIGLVFSGLHQILWAIFEIIRQVIRGDYGRDDDDD